MHCLCKAQESKDYANSENAQWIYLKTDRQQVRVLSRFLVTICKWSKLSVNEM